MPLRDGKSPPLRREANQVTALVVCPACSYGFPDDGRPPMGENACPRSACGHRWEADTETIRAVHGSERRHAQPELSILAGDRPATIDLPEGESLIGRDLSSLVTLENLSVSRRHARVIRQAERVWIEDLGSACGSLLNGKAIKVKTPLTACDTLVIGGVTLLFSVRFTATEVGKQYIDNEQVLARAANAAPRIEGAESELIPLNRGRITFGRGFDRDVVLPDALISRRHAVLDCQDGRYYLSDAQSRIGTFVNGKSIIRAQLESGDRVQLGPYLFRFEGTKFVRVHQLSCLALTAVGISQSAGVVQLLDGVHLVIQPGEFVGLLGPSGAGKTTLLDALNGLRPARTGAVLVNGEPLYEQYDRLRHLIGYVPQDDIIHRELTSRQALSFAAQLRLPSDVTSDEIQRLVNQTLQTLDLTARADVPIHRLSGGQRKRASVGVELLSKPGILFLDEPTSGLDPGVESRLMRMFKQLANQGRTVVCTTHVMENVDLFDKIAILAPGGKLAYFGPPNEAKAYFAIDKFTLLYDRLEDKSPAAWKEEFALSDLHARLLGPAMAGPEALGSPRRQIAHAPASLAVSQWLILTRRYLTIFGSDRHSIALLAAQPVLIAGLICLVSSDLPQILFLFIVSGIWFGCSNAAQEIVKERTIYRRERMVNLRLECYVLSKFLPLAAICTAQCTMMFLMIAIFNELQGSTFVLYTAPLFASWNAVAMGLIISALASNPDKAMFVVPLSLLPQIILSGVLVALPTMSTPMQLGSCLAVSRWANQAVEVALLEGRIVDQELLADDANYRPLWNLYPNHDFRTEQGRRVFVQENQGIAIHKFGRAIVAYLVLGGFLASQLVVVGLILRRQDVF